ncbi:MAG TPA: cell division protein ZapB [Candidatus Eisenbacteria bacterium]
MTDRMDDIEPILEALEARVARAVTRIRELSAENRRLKASGSAATPAVTGITNGSDTAALEERIRELDRERVALLADRRALTQRVEQIIARLEYLESETVTH